MPFDDLMGHEGAKAMLRAAIRQDRLASAYLFHGEPAIGKFAMAVRFAQAINCETPPADMPDACGGCRSCQQIEARSHPDCLFVEPDPEQTTPQIKIDQVREIDHQMIYRPLVGRRKMCVIDQADRMTLGAANALLKTLEEPPGHGLFVLVSARPLALPATIRSRCQSVRFAPPPRAEVEAALIEQRRLPPAEAKFLSLLTQGRIGEALTLDLAAARAQQQDLLPLTTPMILRSAAALLTATEALAKSDRAPDAMEWIARWLRDVMLVQAGADPDLLLHGDRLAELREAAARLPTEPLLDVLGQIEAAQRGSTRNLNPQLALENILLALRDAYALQSQAR